MIQNSALQWYQAKFSPSSVILNFTKEDLAEGSFHFPTPLSERIVFQPLLSGEWNNNPLQEITIYTNMPVFENQIVIIGHSHQ